MAKPAARIGDMHTCPMSDGPKPHVGGPITGPGIPTVLIGSMPAAVIGDLCTCVGTPDAISSGSAGVMIGGKPAARMGDKTIHGGLIVMGLSTVLIGDIFLCKGAGKGGSTKITINDDTKVIFINTKLEYTGPDASEEYAKAAKKQIEETWSGKMTRNGKEYKIIVSVDTKVNTTGTSTAGYDQIIVDKSTGRMSQNLYGCKPGYQTPEAANDAKRPRRIAHEYGHTLGLPDGYRDDKVKGSVPIDPNKKNDIMSETWPDANGVLPHPHQDHYETVLSDHKCNG